MESIFWDPRVEAGRVTVDVAAGGDVTLTGTVASRDEARAAYDDAIRAGAEHVTNRLRVGEAPAASADGRAGASTPSPPAAPATSGH